MNRRTVLKGLAAGVGFLIPGCREPKPEPKNPFRLVDGEFRRKANESAYPQLHIIRFDPNAIVALCIVDRYVRPGEEMMIRGSNDRAVMIKNLDSCLVSGDHVYVSKGRMLTIPGRSHCAS